MRMTGQSHPLLAKTCGAWLADAQQRRGRPLSAIPTASSNTASAESTTGEGESQIDGSHATVNVHDALHAPSVRGTSTIMPSLVLVA